MNVEGAGTIDHGKTGLSDQTVINDWAKIVNKAGYGAGIYAGQYMTQQPLNGHQLYNDLIVNHYWLNCSTSGREEIVTGHKRGYQIIQRKCNTSYRDIPPLTSTVSREMPSKTIR